MTGQGSAREVLIVEALGDVAKLLDRVDGLVAALDVAREDVERVSARLQTQAVAIDERLVLLTEHAKTETVKHIVRHADGHARRLAASQTQAMRATAQTLFEEELRPALQRLGQFVDARVAQRNLRRDWWINVAMLMSVVLLLCTLTRCLLCK